MLNDIEFCCRTSFALMQDCMGLWFVSTSIIYVGIKSTMPRAWKKVTNDALLCTWTMSMQKLAAKLGKYESIIYTHRLDTYKQITEY